VALQESQHPQGDGSEDAPPGPDLDRVMAEIEDEVRRRRASGDFPPSFERRLDALFARFTPVGAREGHFRETLKQADRHAYIDIDVPILSEKPAVRHLKRVLRTLMAWYLNYVVQQVTRFTASLMRVQYMVAERLEELEQLTEPLRAPLLQPADLTEGGPDLAGWAELVCSELAGCGGRVLHAECGEGLLLERLGAAGVEAYGVDRRAGLLDRAVAKGLDARLEDPLEHLRSVADQTLGGLVLSGFLDGLTVWEQRRLAQLAAAKLRPGARLVLIGTPPEAWRSQAPVVEADLSPGRPLHAQTWAHLLEEAGLSPVAKPGPATDALAPVPAEVPGAAVINANLERLNRTLFGPSSFAVVATRGS
jgi:SAM-dependent methyltransferase